MNIQTVIKRIAAVTLVATLVWMWLGAYQPQETKDTAHEIAELARSLGLGEDDPIIVRARELWWGADEEFCADRDIIATVVYNEAWGGCSERHRELVAAVVVNRVASELFPNTVTEVVAQKGQYHPAYVYAGSIYGQRARADAEVWAQCQDIASRALLGEVECPSDVLYQAEFVQGSAGVYKTHETTYSTTYFCFG